MNSLPDYCPRKYHEIKRLPQLHVLLLRVCGFVSFNPIDNHLLLVQISGKMAKTQFYINKNCLRYLDEMLITF